ncbi:hypothetical protein BDW72DRAFT_95479 [Aspergillus terricola var. indicus]
MAGTLQIAHLAYSIAAESQLDKYLSMRLQMLRRVTDSRNKIQNNQGDCLVVSHIFPSLGWTCSTPSRPISLSGLLQEQLRRERSLAAAKDWSALPTDQSLRATGPIPGWQLLHRRQQASRLLRNASSTASAGRHQNSYAVIPVMIRVVLISSAGQAPTSLQSTDLQFVQGSLCQNASTSKKRWVDPPAPIAQELTPDSPDFLSQLLASPIVYRWCMGGIPGGLPIINSV